MPKDNCWYILAWFTVPISVFGVAIGIPIAVVSEGVSADAMLVVILIVAIAIILTLIALPRAKSSK